MNPASTYHFQYSSPSVGHTRRLGRRIGSEAFEGLIIALSGDLGSGKTAFVQGLAVGLDVPAEYTVTSPSYTLINAYPGRLELYHADLYRIENKVDFDEIGLYEVLHGHGVCAVEWAEKLAEDLPDEHLAIHLSIVDDRQRRIELTAHGPETVQWIKRIAHALKE